MLFYSDDYECPRVCLGNYNQSSWFCLRSPIGEECKLKQEEKTGTAAEKAAEMEDGT